jgi:HK97 family phage prohead protease
METRNNTAVDFELRNHPTDGQAPGTVVGYAAVWDTLSLDLGGFREKLKPWCMDTCFGASDVHALYNHDSSMVLGRSRSGTLQVAPDTKGLNVQIDLPNTSTSRDLWQNLLLNNITGMSFGFTIAPNGEEWTADEAGNPVRTITEVSQLFEVSICAMPAYPSTSIAIASLRNYQQEGDTLRRHVEAESRERVMRLCGA